MQFPDDTHQHVRDGVACQGQRIGSVDGKVYQGTYLSPSDPAQTKTYRYILAELDQIPYDVRFDNEKYIVVNVDGLDGRLLRVHPSGAKWLSQRLFDKAKGTTREPLFYRVAPLVPRGVKITRPMRPFVL